ncbi:skin secretory protein xP2-like [Elephas maximus indicus]|uniref:skin secretory protein xP2-like n=1 Tax=Elephas maximus indicus TaxID=99487 RepID=UPI0021165372|nr:skin secretory protein xP2-like [Elephas maximus indicus]
MTTVMKTKNQNLTQELQQFKHRTFLDGLSHYGTAQAGLVRLIAPGWGLTTGLRAVRFLTHRGGICEGAGVLESGGGAGSPRFLTERARLQSWAPGAGPEPRGRPRREGGEKGKREGPGTDGVPEGECGAGTGRRSCLPGPVPVFPWRWPLRDSICQRSLLLLLGPGRAPPPAARGTQTGAESPSAVRRAAQRPEGSGDAQRRRRAVAAERGGGRIRMATPRRARSRRRRRRPGRSEAAETMRPAWPRAARLRVRGAALPGPTWPSSGSPAPSGPGKGHPLVPAFGEGRRPATAEPGNLGAGKSLRRLRGAARRDSPFASAAPAGDFLDSSSAGPAPAGTAGRAGVRPRAPAPRAADELWNDIKDIIHEESKRSLKRQERKKRPKRMSEETQTCS